MSIRKFIDVCDAAYQQDLCVWTRTDGTPCCGKAGVVKNWGEVQAAMNAAMATAHRLGQVPLLEPLIQGLFEALQHYCQTTHQSTDPKTVNKAAGPFVVARDALQRRAGLEDALVSDGPSAGADGANSTLEQMLRSLAQRDSWRLSELPDVVSKDALVALDVDGHIEVRLHTEHAGDQTTVNTLGWRSPVHTPRAYGQWSQLWKSRDQGTCHLVEIRVKEGTRAKLALNALSWGQIENANKRHDQVQSVPIKGADAAETINRMLQNDPGWGWKHCKAWLHNRDVCTYSRSEWRKQFGHEPPKTNGNPCFVEETALLRAIRNELNELQRNQERAHEEIDRIEKEKVKLRKAKTS